MPVVASLLLTLTAFAGCLGASVPAAVAPPMPEPATDAAHGAGPRAAEGEVRAIPITGLYTDYPTGIGESCHGATDCEAVIPFGIHFSGTLHGEGQGIAHGGARSFDPSAPTHVAFNKDPVSFAGSIEGCGSGTMSMHIEGYFAADPAVPINETGQLIPGSGSSGLSGLVDMFWSFADGGAGYPEPVTIVGTAWCR